MLKNRRIAGSIQNYDYQSDDASEHSDTADSDSVNRTTLSPKSSASVKKDKVAHTSGISHEQVDVRRSVQAGGERLDAASTNSSEATEEIDQNTQTRWIIEIPLSSSAHSSQNESNSSESNVDDVYDDGGSGAFDSSDSSSKTSKNVDETEYEYYYKQPDTNVDDEPTGPVSNTGKYFRLAEDIERMLNDKSSSQFRQMLYDIDVFSETLSYYYEDENYDELYGMADTNNSYSYQSLAMYDYSWNHQRMRALLHFGKGTNSVKRIEIWTRAGVQRENFYCLNVIVPLIKNF